MALIVYSGGLDSTVLLHYLKATGKAFAALMFDYGQKHKKELEFAVANCKKLGVPYDIANLTSITSLFGGNSLTDAGVDVPEGGYKDENMMSTRYR